MAMTLVGCRNETPPPAVAPKPAAPRFQLADSKVEASYDAAQKRAKIAVTTGPSTTIVLAGEGGKLDEVTTDGTGKATLTLTEGQLPPGKNHFTVALSNPFGQQHTLTIDVEVGAPTRFVLHPKEADEKVPAAQLAMTDCVATLEGAEFSTKGSGRQLKTVRSLAFVADLPGATALELDGKEVPLKDGKAAFEVEPLKYLAALSGSDAVATEGVTFVVPSR